MVKKEGEQGEERVKKKKRPAKKTTKRKRGGARMPAEEDAFHSEREKGEMRRVDAYRSYFRIDLDIADVFSWTML